MWNVIRAPELLRPLKDAIVFSNLHIGLIAVSFLLGTSVLVGVPPSPPLLVLAFCGAFLVYQLERGLGYAPEDSFNHEERLAWIARHETYFKLSVAVTGIAGLCMLPFLNAHTLAICAGLGVLSILYMAPVLPGRHRMKSSWVLKPLLISGGWAVGGVVLPVIQAGAAVTPAIIMLTFYRLLFVMPNTLMADWPDRRGDRQAGLQTAATRLSPANLKRIVGIFLLGCIIVGLLTAQLHTVSNLLYLDLLGSFALLSCVLMPWSDSRWLYSFFIDIIMAWPAVTAISAWFR